MKESSVFGKNLRRWVITGGMTAALLLSGCGSSKATRPAMNTAAEAGAGAQAMMDYDGAPAESYDEAESYDTADVYAEGGSFDKDASGIEVNTPQTTNRKLIRNVNLEVETQDFQTLIANVTNRVKTLGGYIENSNIYNGSTFSGEMQRNATMTLRIPSAKADIFLMEVADQSNITQQNENVNDVTLEYVDLESHKKVLLAEEENLIELLEATTDIDDMITLESRISNLRYQIESMESQLRTYDNKVDYTTITLHVSEVVELTEITEPEPEPEEPTTWERISTGFADNLNRVVTTFTDLLVWFLSNLPSLLVWAVIIFIIVKIIKRLSPDGDSRSFGQAKKEKKNKNAKEGKAEENPAQRANAEGFHWPENGEKKD